MVEEPDFKIPPRMAEYPRVPLLDNTLLPAFSPYSDEPTVTTMGEMFVAIFNAIAARIPELQDHEGKIIDLILESDLLPPSDTAVFTSSRTMKQINDAIGNIDLVTTEEYSPIDYPEIWKELE